MNEPTRGLLEITFVDVKANAFRSLGGAGFTTMAETRRRFNEVPAVEDSWFVLDLLDADGDILDDKCITKETAEALLGEPVLVGQ